MCAAASTDRSKRYSSVEQVPAYVWVIPHTAAMQQQRRNRMIVKNDDV